MTTAPSGDGHHRHGHHGHHLTHELTTSTQDFDLPYAIRFLSTEATAVSQTVSFVNTSDTELSLSEVTSSIAAFTETENLCTDVLAAAASCDVTLTYAPGDETRVSAVAPFTANDGSVISDALTGLNVVAIETLDK